ncbi:MAG TPA: glycosyl hydrolase [Syntrophomonas sp.]|nr:glycosyl hydrolase [Syntrophomonas sp.]
MLLYIAAAVLLLLVMGGAWIYMVRYHDGYLADDKIISKDAVKTIVKVDDQYLRLYNYAGGYAINYPAGWQPDLEEAALKSDFTDRQNDLEVYCDDFNGTVSDAKSYIGYSNGFLERDQTITGKTNKYMFINGRPANLIKWQRPPLQRVANDKNHYICVKLIENNRLVYTILMKSSRPIDEQKFMRLVKSFRPVEKHENLAPTLHPVVAKQWNAETVQAYEQYFGPQAQLKWGIYEPKAPGEMENLNAVEKSLDYKFHFLIRYQNLDETLPLQDLQTAWEQQRLLELTLQLGFMRDYNAAPYNPSGVPLAEFNANIIPKLLNGDFDDYLQQYARDIKKFGHPILFRLNNEMNGDWCVYCSYHYGNDADLYIEAWKYIYNIFAANQVDNVIWVWNPHDLSFPDFGWNNYLNYFPGSEYVDIIGLTGYNTGTYYEGERWREFADIYGPLYAEYSQHFAQPFMITEFGCNSVGGDKAKWLQDMFAHIDQYPRIKAAIFFSSVDMDWSKNQPARIYRIDETEAVLNTVKTGLSRYQ